MFVGVRCIGLRRGEVRVICEFWRSRGFSSAGQWWANDLRRKIFISFGGLLLYMDGPWRKLANLTMDHVYLLVKK